ncbi:MAG TPA: DUF131 domain-containing protein [Thermoplasmata archaeon]|nr:DUF131 domain-containing protein [Thermoplasmata archaeon]
MAAAAFWLAGAACVALSIAEGGASIALVVVIPVISGSSAAFVVGVALVIAGFVAMLFAASANWPEEPETAPPSTGDTTATSTSQRSGSAGGFVLIGPVPIVFGSWRGISRRDRWLLALVGAAVLIAVLAATLWLWR